MTFYFFLYIFSLYFGYFYNINRSIIFPLSLLIFYTLFKKNFLLSLSLLIVFLSGYILSLKENVELNEGFYELELSVKRNFKYGYITNSDGIKIFLNTDMIFLEGDRIYGKFKIEKIDFNNDHEKFLETYDVFFKSTILQIDSVKSENSIDRLRTILVNRVKERYTEKKISGFINSIIFGYRKELDPELKKDFINSGVIHLLAISGQHVLIIYSFLFFLLYFFPIKKKFKVILSILILIFYSFLTYNNPPVVRSVIFITIFLLGELLEKRVDKQSLIFLTLIFMLILNDSNFKDNGLVLSFLAVYGIYISNDVLNLKTGLLKIFLTSVVVLILTMPYMMFQFKYISVGSPIFTTMLYLPFSFFIPLSLLSLLPFFGFLQYPVIYIFKFIEKVVSFSEKMYLMYEFQIDLFIFIFFELSLITLFYKKYKISCLFSSIIFIYVILKINHCFC
ncbi:MAG: ComEC/Rec2 family competence protein [candidate division WOR-3 bacterium]